MSSLYSNNLQHVGLIEITCTSALLGHLEVGCSSSQGLRDTMEDSQVVSSIEGLHGHCLFGILDGHAGGGASSIASQQLKRVLLNTVQWQRYLESVGPASPLRTPEEGEEEGLSDHSDGEEEVEEENGGVEKQNRSRSSSSSSSSPSCSSSAGSPSSVDVDDDDDADCYGDGDGDGDNDAAANLGRKKKQRGSSGSSGARGGRQPLRGVVRGYRSGSNSAAMTPSYAGSNNSSTSTSPANTTRDDDEVADVAASMMAADPSSSGSGSSSSNRSSSATTTTAAAAAAAAAAAVTTTPEQLKLLSAALVEAFLAVDQLLLESTVMDRSGTTAVCALVTPSHILCASAGDSRCILGSGGKCIALSEDHRPDDLKERMRIERAGHFVAMHRVDGELAMSRALGDFQYKTRPLFPRSEQAVTCVPDIEVHERSTADEVLVLASDGVWDVLSNRDAVTFLSEFLIKHDSHLTMRQAAGALVELSLRQGSTDNVSSVVVRLGKLRGERVASGDSNTTNTNNRGSSSASVKKRKRA